MLCDLFENVRKNEPKSILIFRRSVVVILIALTIVAFVILCKGVQDEIPSINTTLNVAKSLPVPGKNNSLELKKKNSPKSNVMSPNIKTMNQYSLRFFLYS